MFKVYAPEQGSYLAIAVHESEEDALKDGMHIEAEMWQKYGIDIQTKIVNQVSGSNNH